MARRTRAATLGLLAMLWAVGCGRPPPPTPEPDAGFPPDIEEPSPPAVILMIGDGMGDGQLLTASEFGHGRPDGLFLQSLPVQGRVRTASLSGITDSAAAATTLATGQLTLNGRVGTDRDGQPLETLVERAKRLGLWTGLVTTASLPHATPGAFSAHRPSRHQYVDIATDQALLVKPEVMLGGGTRFYLPKGQGSDRADDGLIAPLQADGYQLAQSFIQLSQLPLRSPPKVLGLFAPEHLTYVLDRATPSAEPTLPELTREALRHLESSPQGFFLMIEGARIDMASHANDLGRTIAETLAFDEAVRAVHGWAQGRRNVTVLVTADHECGGLELVAAKGQGNLPDVRWRWGNHTNAQVPLFGFGEGAARFDDQVVHHRDVHAFLAARVSGTEIAPLPPALIPDGHLGELRYAPAAQHNASGFGEGFNRLDVLRVDADARGLTVGVAGLFEWGKNSLVLLLDVDFGQGTGPARLSGALTDRTGKVDSVLSSLSLDAPGVTGFGADYAVVSFGGEDPRLEDLLDRGGLRGLGSWSGSSANLSWLPAATNFGEAVRVGGQARSPAPDEGFEVQLGWEVLFPGQGGKVPAGTELALFAVLVNDDGGYTSNQALPPFAPGTANPGRILTPLPGVIRLILDHNRDGIIDDNLIAEVLSGG
jgi:alkaline phosphatase